MREIGRGAYGVVYLATGSDGTKRGEENNRRINALHDEGRDKAVTKQDAAERYNQAEMISMENEKLVKAWLSLLERFTEIEDAVKLKK